MVPARRLSQGERRVLAPIRAFQGTALTNQYPQQPEQPQYGQPPMPQPYPNQPLPYGQQYPQQFQQQPAPYPQQGIQGRPGPQYVRQQRGHSTIKHVVVACFTCGFSLPVTLYYSMSPNHYFHA